MVDIGIGSEITEDELMKYIESSNNLDHYQLTYDESGELQKAELIINGDKYWAVFKW
mgnify:CR=1 FL=1